MLSNVFVSDGVRLPNVFFSAVIANQSKVVSHDSSRNQIKQTCQNLNESTSTITFYGPKALFYEGLSAILNNSLKQNTKDTLLKIKRTTKIT